MMNPVQFGAMRPGDIQKGAVFVGNNDRIGPKRLYVVTSEPGKLSIQTGGMTQQIEEVRHYSDAPSRRRVSSIKIPDQVAVPFEAEQYTEQADGTYLKTGKTSGTPITFPLNNSGQAIQEGYDVVAPEKIHRDGDKLSIDA